MANRKRTIRHEIKTSEEEEAMILEKMALIPTNNFNNYAIKMMVDGYIIKHDFTELRGLTSELGKIGSNINQIAKHANETHVVPKQDVKEILKMLHEIQIIINDRLGRLLNQK